MESPGGQEASGLDELSTQPAPCHPVQCWGGLSERAWTPCPSSAPRCRPTGGGPGGPPFAKKQLKQGGDRSRAPHEPP